MFEILKDLRKRRLLFIRDTKIDNVLFFLHYKVTTVLLVVFTLMLTKRQYFGDPINCLAESIRSHTIDMYCWIHSTYTIPELTGAKVGEEVAHPGVGNIHRLHDNADAERLSVRRQKYYQWVVPFLFLQAIMFYMPRYLWKRWEAGRVDRLVTGLHLPVGDPSLRQKGISVAVEYFSRYFHLHNVYAFQYFFCEVLNFVNIIGQFYFTDRFLDYGFMDYGPRATAYAQSKVFSGHDPKDEIFPKVAKCVFHSFGPSGTIRRHDILCVLPLNILNEKIFAFLWYWFVALAVITGVGLLYRMATFLPAFRTFILRRHSRLVSEEEINIISRKCYIGDWLILNLMGKNVDAFTYRDFIHHLCVRLAETEHVK